MERKLFGIMTVAAVLAIGFGVAMLALAPDYLLMRWLQLKLLLVLLLIAYHGACFALLQQFAADRNCAFGTLVPGVQRDPGAAADRHRDPGGREAVLILCQRPARVTLTASCALDNVLK